MTIKSHTQTIKHILQSNKGFSLIEILIALTLLAVAGTFVVGKIFDQLEEGRVSAAKIQLNSFKDRLNEFRRHCGTFPTTEQGLESLVEKPAGGKDCPRYNPGGYIEGGKVPKDPWENDYTYESDGKAVKIKTYGSDGAEGGEGWDADISSADL